jgi:hypothetical protein
MKPLGVVKTVNVAADPGSELRIARAGSALNKFCFESDCNSRTLAYGCRRREAIGAKPGGLATWMQDNHAGIAFQGRAAIAWLDTVSNTRLPPVANTSVLTTATLRPFCSTVERDLSALPWPGLMNQALAAVSKG